MEKECAGKGGGASLLVGYLWCAAGTRGIASAKMLTLTPKLRAARADAKRQTLHNAVPATDQQIDALVYELYSLTPEEIKLVEASGA